VWTLIPALRRRLVLPRKTLREWVSSRSGWAVRGVLKPIADAISGETQRSNPPETALSNAARSYGGLPLAEENKDGSK
jgi:hypothetical protein